MRLIDADELAEAFEKHQIHLTTVGDKLSSLVWQDAKFAVWDAPTVDAVEVVRCKDCKHFSAFIKPVEDFDGLCDFDIGICGEVDEDFFCQYGERKDGEK